MKNHALALATALTLGAQISAAQGREVPHTVDHFGSAVANCVSQGSISEIANCQLKRVGGNKEEQLLQPGKAILRNLATNIPGISLEETGSGFSKVTFSPLKNIELGIDPNGLRVRMNILKIVF